MYKVIIVVLIISIFLMFGDVFLRQQNNTKLLHEDHVRLEEQHQMIMQAQLKNLEVAAANGQKLDILLNMATNQFRDFSSHK